MFHCAGAAAWKPGKIGRRGEKRKAEQRTPGLAAPVLVKVPSDLVGSSLQQVTHLPAGESDQMSTNIRAQCMHASDRRLFVRGCAAGMSGPDEGCTDFQPQQWRADVCRHCFVNASEHPAHRELPLTVQQPTSQPAQAIHQLPVQQRAQPVQPPVHPSPLPAGWIAQVCVFRCVD